MKETINIRKGIFETNSSSCHSITIADSVELLESLYVDQNGSITLEGGQFGWQWEKYNDALTKANYAAVFAVEIKKNTDLLVEVLKEHTGAKEIVFNFSSEYGDDRKGKPWAYIDHDSAHVASDAFVDKESLKNWIFNPKSWLFLGNDNNNAPPNFYLKL